MARATTSKKANTTKDAPAVIPSATTPATTAAERRVRKADRRKEVDRRAFPPRAEGRRVVGGRRKGDPIDA